MAALRVGEPVVAKVVLDKGGVLGQSDICSLLGEICNMVIDKYVRLKGADPRRLW